MNISGCVRKFLDIFVNNNYTDMNVSTLQLMGFSGYCILWLLKRPVYTWHKMLIVFKMVITSHYFNAQTESWTET